MRVKTKRRLKIFGFWVLVWLLESLLMSGGKHVEFYLVKNIPIVGLQFLLVWINSVWLFPNFFRKQKYLLYALVSSALLYVVLVVSFVLIDVAFMMSGMFESVEVQLSFPTNFWNIVSGSTLYALALIISTIYLMLRNGNIEITENLTSKDEVLLLKEGHKTHLIPVRDIFYVKGLGEYVTWQTKSGKVVTLRTLHSVESELSTQGFLRVHRSFVVNVHNIERVESNSLQVGGDSIPVGRTYKEEVRSFFTAAKTKNPSATNGTGSAIEYIETS